MRVIGRPVPLEPRAISSVNPVVLQIAARKGRCGPLLPFRTQTKIRFNAELSEVTERSARVVAKVVAAAFGFFWIGARIEVTYTFKDAVSREQIEQPESQELLAALARPYCAEVLGDLTRRMGLPPLAALPGMLPAE